MIQTQVEAQSLQPGDIIENKPPPGRAPYHVPFRFVEVIEVSTNGDVSIIRTTAWVTWKQATEGIAVWRDCECQK